MTDPWIEAEKNCLPSILEDLSCEIDEDFINLSWATRRYDPENVEEWARMLIRRGRQYLALKRRLQFD